MHQERLQDIHRSCFDTEQSVGYCLPKSLTETPLQFQIIVSSCGEDRQEQRWLVIAELLYIDALGEHNKGEVRHHCCFASGQK